MKVRCLNCGLVLEKCLSLECVCPECGGISWYRFGHEVTMMELTMKERAKCDREEGLAFEIFEVEDGKKVKVRKIYFDGHIEGFEGKPCIINYAYPIFLKFKAVIVDMIRQINEDYMKIAERHIMADMPITTELDCLRKAYLERINNIKI